MKPHLVALLWLLPACGGSSEDLPGPSPAEALAALRAGVASLHARAEHHDPEVTLQHCLVGVKGQMDGATRSPEEAEALAAEIYARARAGEDFDLLVKNHSDDVYPCTYTLTLAAEAPPGTWPRAEMVPAFGDTAWRLAVGEIGAAAYDGPAQEAHSPYGWHVIKRLK